MRTFLLTLTTTLALNAGSATALSCMRPDVARAFNWAAQAEESYVVLLGRLDFALPRGTGRGGYDPNPQSQSFPARFSGQSLGLEGFAPTNLRDVTVTFECLGPWCGSLQPGTEVLAFARRTGRGYELSIDPCFSNVFDRPSPEDVARVEACMRGQGCTEQPMR